MASPAHSPSVIRFGAFELDPAHATLRKAGISVKLHPQPFRVLSLLAECPGQIVTREQIQRCLWGDNTFVDFEGGINFCVKQIRAALGDDPEKPRYIETLHRRGYRFIAPTHVTARAAESTEGRADLRIVSEGETTPPEAIADHAPQVGGSPFQISRPKTSFVTKRLLTVLAGCAVLTLVAALARPVVPPPRLTRVHQITHVGTVVWNESILVSGSRLYFLANENGENQIRYVSLDDGAVSVVEKPFAKIVGLHDIAPSGSELLVSEFEKALAPSWHRVLWRLPVAEGTPRRVGTILADDSAWSPDGRTIVYTNEAAQSLYLVDGDGSNSRKLTSLPGIPFKPRWSPDGKLIRTSVVDPKEAGISIWQTDASGRSTRQMLPGWKSSSRSWSGNWTRDGRYFFFTAMQGGTRNIWALRDKKDIFRKNSGQPVQLTEGPFNYYMPTPGSNGKTIYAIGSQPLGQLMRYDARSGEFAPYANGQSIDHVAFSRDGKWMAYVTYPEGTLVRSRIDGSERMQLTSAPIRAASPQWSPDGTQIAFGVTVEQGPPQKIYLVSANGGSSRMVVDGAGGDLGLPNWSSDGQSLVFAASNESRDQWALHSLNLKTGKDMVLPGSLGIASGALTPDGRYYAGTSGATQSLVLYDMVSGASRQLAEVADYPSWSADGKYVYYSTLTPDIAREKTGVYRVKIADGSVELVVPAPNFPLAGSWGIWNGLTPDGSIMLVRELGTSDIYALDADLP
jgi:Tol biopolymer transport system component/DNA-binding winged helix-turn-helix (wHTH) protein